VTASSWLSPAPTVAVPAAVSMVADFRSLTSMTMPSSTLDHPSRLCRPLRARGATPLRRAQVSALTTSVVFWANTMTAGRRSKSRL
jgi:hypothetical protein